MTDEETTEEERENVVKEFKKMERQLKRFIHEKVGQEPGKVMEFCVTAAFHAGALTSITALSISGDVEDFMKRVRDTLELGSQYGVDKFKEGLLK